MPNIILAVQLLTTLFERGAAIAALMNKAQAEKRDITSAELDALAAQDDAAKAKLDAAIKAARGGT